MSTVAEALLIDGVLLVLTAALAVAAFALWPRVTEPRRRDPDHYEAAFLTGGPARVVDTAVAGMIATDRLRVVVPGLVAVTGEAPADPVQQAVVTALGSSGSGALGDVRREVALSPVVQEIGDRLARGGLLVRPGSGRRAVRRWAIAQLILLAVAIPAVVLRTVFGYDGGVPLAVMVVPLIIPCLIVTAVVVGALPPRTTSAGWKAVRAYRFQYASHNLPAAGVALRGPRGASDTSTRELLLAAAAVPIAVPVSGGAVGVTAAVWCGSGSDGGSSYGGNGAGSSCGGGGSSCGGGGSSCGGGGSSCGGGGGSSCGGGGSSCGGGGGGG
ncbi:TIGR04222 domain-containing membrane protein [Streptomyces sp. NPDC006798]|uniref:TIGR04222 domain-containing membrane protein n=1 Tax=Streptomyces sp. NPDC006798 TaxID=3155462 RepID=UPI00341156EF